LATQTIERAEKLRPEQAELALDAIGAADHHMVGAGNALRRHDFTSKRAESALHSVAHDGAADFLGDGEADAHRLVLIFAITNQQDEAGGGRALAAVRGKKVGALLDDG
jgi:hypothetical protein